MPYKDRLMHLNLPTLKYRRLRGDMIEVFKITHNIYDSEVSPNLRPQNLTPEVINANYLTSRFIMIYLNILFLLV